MPRSPGEPPATGEAQTPLRTNRRPSAAAQRPSQTSPHSVGSLPPPPLPPASGRGRGQPRALRRSVVASPPPFPVRRPCPAPLPRPGRAAGGSRRGAERSPARRDAACCQVRPEGGGVCPLSLSGCPPVRGVGVGSVPLERPERGVGQPLTAPGPGPTAVGGASRGAPPSPSARGGVRGRQAWLPELAVGCGYCLDGSLVSVRASLVAVGRNPPPRSTFWRNTSRIAHRNSGLLGIFLRQCQ